MLGLIIFAYIFIIADLILTRYWVKKYGLEIEGNPVGKWILEKPWRQIVFKLVVPMAVLIFLYLYKSLLVAKIGICVIFTMYLLLVCYHFYIYMKIKRLL